MKSKKSIHAVILIVAVIGSSAYASHKAYGNYTQATSRNLQLADIETMANDEGPWNPVCYNGGVGSNQCSIDAGISIAGYGVSTACSVTCDPGYYSCCGLRCTCKPK